MAKAPRAQKIKPRTAVCPITGKELMYKGVGRMPIFHESATAKQRREYRNGK